MPAFEFSGVGRIVFGRGKFSMAGDLAKSLGRSALVIYNGNANESRVQTIARSGVQVHAIRQRGEPVVSQVDAAVEEARRRECDCVIGIGGGSAIDAAKAVAGLLTSGGSAIDYMEVVGNGRKISRLSAPWMAIPTTAGTGAEATRNAVIGLPEKKFKASIRSEMLLPRIALVDPDLGADVSPAVTAGSGMDAICQLIESYTSLGASPMTDALALTGIPLAAKNLPTAFADGGNLAAREAMAMAALLSGMTLTNAGLGAVHGFAAPIGANFPVPHGIVCAALLPNVIQANIQALRSQTGGEAAPALSRYAAIGEIFASTGEPLDACVSFITELKRQLKIPPLKEFGIGERDIPEMVALARRTSSMKFNPVQLSEDALSDVLRQAIY
jgi:alcohol dehydrogenase class IV